MDSVVQQDRVNMSEAEWQARCDLAALYRITDLFGWTDTIDTHMSVRIPGEPDCFLINNYGDLFNEITASSLVKLDIDGKVYSTDGRFNAAGFTIHSGVYKAQARRQLRHAHPYPRRHRRLGAEEGTAPDQPGRARGVGRPRLSRVRHADVGRGMRGARHHLPGRKLRRAAQPRPADGRASRSRARCAACTCWSAPARSKSSPAA